MIASGPGQDLGTQFITWVKSVPAHTQFIWIWATVTYAFAWFLPIDGLFVNYPSKVIEGVQIWRMFTCAYVVCYLITYVFMLMIYIPSACYRERDIGSVRYLIYFLLNNALGQALYIAMDYPFYNMLLPDMKDSSDLVPYFNFQGGGLWVIMMADMVIRNYQYPDREVNFFCCPFSTKAKYTHWCFFVTLSIMFLRVRFDLLAGVIVGYLHLLGVMKWTVLSDRLGTSIEACFVFKGLQKMRNYISTAESGQDSVEGENKSDAYVPPDLELNSTAALFQGSKDSQP